MWQMFSRNKAVEPAHVKRIKQLELDFGELKTELDALNRKHYKLSGAVYSRLKLVPPPEAGVEPDRRLSSHEILKRAGYFPGQPMPHIPENAE